MVGVQKTFVKWQITMLPVKKPYIYMMILYIYIYSIIIRNSDPKFVNICFELRPKCIVQLSKKIVYWANFKGKEEILENTRFKYHSSNQGQIHHLWETSESWHWSTTCRTSFWSQCIVNKLQFYIYSKMMKYVIFLPVSSNSDLI